MRKLYYAVPLIAGLVGMSLFFAPRGKAESHGFQEAPCVVVLQGDSDYGNPNQFVVGTVTSSPGAPQIKEGENLAEALTLLRAAHFQITVHAWGFLTYTAIR